VKSSVLLVSEQFVFPRSGKMTEERGHEGMMENEAGTGTTIQRGHGYWYDQMMKARQPEKAAEQEKEFLEQRYTTVVEENFKLTEEKERLKNELEEAERRKSIAEDEQSRAPTRDFIEKLRTEKERMQAELQRAQLQGEQHMLINAEKVKTLKALEQQLSQVKQEYGEREKQVEEVLKEKENLVQ
jgi:hypothetical protein